MDYCKGATYDMITKWDYFGSHTSSSLSLVIKDNLASASAYGLASSSVLASASPSADASASISTDASASTSADASASTSVSEIAYYPFN